MIILHCFFSRQSISDAFTVLFYPYYAGLLLHVTSPKPRLSVYTGGLPSWIEV